MGWHSGTRSGVRLAAMTPARRAAASTSPFSTSPRRIRRTVAERMATKPRATATRSVAGLWPTSIIRMAEPSPSAPGRSVDAPLRQPALGVDGGHAPHAGGAHRLAVGGVGHVAGGEHALDRGAHGG